MRQHACGWVAPLVLTVACERVTESSGASAVPIPAPQGVAPSSPPPPRLLAFQLTNCELEHSGFMGMGSERRARITLRNDGARAGIFTVRVLGRYPGGGELEHGVVALPVPAHRTATSTIDFHARDGMLGILCRGEAPPTTE